MTERNTDSFIFASVPYANAAPLVHFLDRLGPEVRVIYALPSGLVRHVLDGWADAALVPVVDCFGRDDLKMIDGIGICADGDVQSVLLKCNRPLEQVRCVRMDAASRTSNALAQIVLEDHLHLPVRMTHLADAPADAEVVIGDRALREPPAPCGDYDLAGLWREMTGLPFVFAVWTYRADHPNPDGLAEIAHRAKAAGMAAIDELAAIQADGLGLSVARCREYLTSAICYDLGPRQREGMRLFEQLLARRAGGAEADRPTITRAREGQA